MKNKQHDNHDEHADGIAEDRKKAPPVYFYVLFYGLIIWGVGFSAYYLLSGWSSEGEFEKKMATHQQTYARTTAPVGNQVAETTQPMTTSDIDAAAIYRSHCAACHGTGGSGGFATDLTDDYAYGKDAESVRVSIADGRGAMMPGFSDSLSAAEIDALVAYLLAL